MAWKHGRASQLRFEVDGREALLLRVDRRPRKRSELTASEIEVAALLVRGHTYGEIAYRVDLPNRTWMERLAEDIHRRRGIGPGGIAVSTVGTHLRNALDKPGLSSQSELAWMYGELRAAGR